MPGSFEVGCPYCSTVVVSLSGEEFASARDGWEDVLDYDARGRLCTVLGGSCLRCRKTITQKVPVSPLRALARA